MPNHFLQDCASYPRENLPPNPREIQGIDIPDLTKRDVVAFGRGIEFERDPKAFNFEKR